MARRARLRPGGTAGWTGSGGALLVILAGVLLLHAVALEWLAHYRLQASVLRHMAEPMFTRLLLPQTPLPQPVFKPKAVPVHVQRAEGAMNLVAKSVSKTATATAQATAPDPVEPTAEQQAPLQLPPASGSVAEASAPSVAPFEISPAVRPPSAAGASPDGLASTTQATTTPDAATATTPGTTTITSAVPDATIQGTASPGTTSPSTATASAAVASAPAPPASTPAPDSWPADTRLNYALSGRFRSGDLYGDARVQWQRSEGRYQVRIDIDLPPWVHQVLASQGVVTPSGLRPEAYEETRRGKARGVRIEPGGIRLDNGRSVTRPDGVQDTASQFVELSHRFATGQDKLEVGQAVSFWMARPGAVDLWTYDVVEREVLRTRKLGDIEAFHLRPRPIANPRGNITAEMWFAPSLQYLPVRIQVKMGDEALVDLLVDTIEQR